MYVTYCVAWLIFTKMNTEGVSVGVDFQMYFLVWQHCQSNVQSTRRNGIFSAVVFLKKKNIVQFQNKDKKKKNLTGTGGLFLSFLLATIETFQKCDMIFNLVCFCRE